MFRTLLLIICGVSFGTLAAAGVFTVLVAVGLVPRFAGKTHTANKIFLYEELVVVGTIFGCLLSVFERYSQIGAFLQERLPGALSILDGISYVVLTVFGIFAGMFIGCLALAIAEMLDSIPIFTRRISFRHGIGLAVLSMAAGKLCGSIFYFLKEIFQVLE